MIKLDSKYIIGKITASFSNLHSRVPVAHTCNPSYSGGRDQEDHGWKPVWA
jgi:hypothetical protein